MDMERLKVLSEEQIQLLDSKIKEYKESKGRTVLNDSIEKLNKDIVELTSMCEKIEGDKTQKECIIAKLKADFAVLEKRKDKAETLYNIANESILQLEESSLKIEASIETLKKEGIDHINQYPVMKIIIADLKTKETELIEKNKELESKLKEDNEIFTKNKESIELDISKQKIKLENYITQRIEIHSGAIDYIKSIDLKPYIGDTELVLNPTTNP
jgi:hypothetical protein